MASTPRCSEPIAARDGSAMPPIIVEDAYLLRDPWLESPIPNHFQRHHPTMRVACSNGTTQHCSKSQSQDTGDLAEEDSLLASQQKHKTQQKPSTPPGEGPPTGSAPRPGRTPLRRLGTNATPSRALFDNTESSASARCGGEWQMADLTSKNPVAGNCANSAAKILLEKAHLQEERTHDLAPTRASEEDSTLEVEFQAGKLGQVMEMCAADLSHWAAVLLKARATGVGNTAEAAAASWMRAGCAMRPGGELDGARSPISSSTLAIFAHCCGSESTIARLWLLPSQESKLQPVCVASSDPTFASRSLLDPTAAESALQTQKICPVLVGKGDSISTSCEQQTAIYAALRAPGSTDEASHTRPMHELACHVLEVLISDDSFDLWHQAPAGKMQGHRNCAIDLPTPCALEILVTFISISLPPLLRNHFPEPSLSSVIELQNETQMLRGDLRDARRRSKSLEKANQWLVSSKCECVAMRISRWAAHERHLRAHGTASTEASESAGAPQDVSASAHAFASPYPSIEAGVGSELMRSLTGTNTPLSRAISRLNTPFHTPASHQHACPRMSRAIIFGVTSPADGLDTEATSPQASRPRCFVLV